MPFSASASLVSLRTPELSIADSKALHADSAALLTARLCMLTALMCTRAGPPLCSSMQSRHPKLVQHTQEKCHGCSRGFRGG